MTEQKKKLDDLPRESEPAEQGTRQTGASVGARAAALEAQIAAKNEVIRQQAEKITQLQQDLDEVRSRDRESLQNIELLQREKAEILAVLERMKGSFGWKVVKAYRRIKNLLLPQGTMRRKKGTRAHTRTARRVSFAASRTRTKPRRATILASAAAE